MGGISKGEKEQVSVWVINISFINSLIIAKTASLYAVDCELIVFVTSSTVIATGYLGFGRGGGLSGNTETLTWHARRKYQ